MAVEPAAQAELTVETKVLSVETRAPAAAEGTETTEIRCIVTRIVQDKSAGKEGVRVGTQLSVLGTCQRMSKPMEARAAGYPSDRCDAGAWTAPFWMKQQQKDQALTLYLKHPIDEKTKKPIADKLETVADRQPASSPATVTVVKTEAPKKK
jgi:hypothetical protein